MLILQRKAGESLIIGDDIYVEVLGIDSGRVRLAIKAPEHIPILRSELRVAMDSNRDAAAETAPLELISQLGNAMEHQKTLKPDKQ